MRNPTRVFLVRLPFTLIAAIVIWLLIRPALDSLITGLAQALIRPFEHPRVTRFVIEDHRVQIRRSDLRVDSKVPSVSLTEIGFNTIVLLALYLALPKPLSRRQLERLLAGWCVLMICQSVNLLFHVKTLYATGLGEWSQHYYSDVARNFYAYGRHFTDLPGRFSFPFLIWLGFNWDAVMKILRVSDGGEKKRKHTQAKVNPKVTS